MRRILLVVTGVVAAIAAILWMRRAPVTPPRAVSPARPTPVTSSVTPLAPRPDPRALARASIAGTVRDAAHAPVARARVCVALRSHDLPDELTRDPRCTDTDARGGYVIDELFAGRYSVGAMAPRMQPARTPWFHLAAGEHRTEVELTLPGGGVAVAGVVEDISGGPIARARITSAELVAVEADDQGRFTLWLAPGAAALTAVADGYAPAAAAIVAPARAVTIALTPESSVAGTVVDGATGAPVAGVRVAVTLGETGVDAATLTDDAGAFKIARLVPGRYAAVARTAHGYGRSEGSVLVGLSQAVEGVVVKLYPAARVEGRVVIDDAGTPCVDSWVTLHEPVIDRYLRMRLDPDGTLWSDGVLPGTYEVTLACEGLVARAHYEPIVVARDDLRGLAWRVDPGATLVGRVTLASGAPVAGASVAVETRADTTRADGTYRLVGLAAGPHRVMTTSHAGLADEAGLAVELPAGATVTTDIVLAEGGTITGSVKDTDGKPVVIDLIARGLQTRSRYGRTDSAGVVRFEAVRPGSYRLTLAQDQPGQLVRVEAGKTVAVALVVEAAHGTITGTVVDADGTPVPDAYVAYAQTVEDTRWGSDGVLTAVDGTFAITKLPSGEYTLRAYRKGGREGIAEHVTPGARVRLQFARPGSIAGTVTMPPDVDELRVAVGDPKTGVFRRETFFRTAGRYQFTDLPGGTFHILAEARGAQGERELTLATGETRTGVDLPLVALVTVTGRIVALGTTTPIAGVKITATSVGGDRTSGGEHVTDASGRFTLPHVALGELELFGIPTDPAGEFAPVIASLRIAGAGTVDVGDLEAVRRRIARTERAGELGVQWAAPGLTVAAIAPAGPAATADLRVGDVVVAIDGVDVRGRRHGLSTALLRAAPGTRLELTLARGTTIAIVLAPAS